MKHSVLTPMKIGRVTVKNRVILPSICTYFCGENGEISDDMMEFVRARARGGTGLLTIGGSPHGKANAGRPSIADESCMVRWEEMAAMVHGYGAVLFCQLHPAKIQAGRGVDVKEIDTYDQETIDFLVESYARGALRCREHGVDGVEIHGGHAHEIAQFLSPLYNHRTDGYGGGWKERARFSVEIIRAIKRLCGDDFPVTFCISGSEYVPGGRVIEESALICLELVRAGADCIHVSCGMPASEQWSYAPMDVDDCFNVSAAETVKRAVSVPVVAVDRIVTLEEADEVISSGRADFVAMGRALLADPDLVNKYMGVNPEPPCVCLGCDQGCRDPKRYKKIRCLQNPFLGREAVLRCDPADEALKKKKIVIIGAGPAGLEAACVLARRGIRPLVVEAAGQPGGLINLSALPPHKENMNRVTQYRLALLQRFGIEVRCGCPATAEWIEKERPDIVLYACGTHAAVPPIPGIDSADVFTGDEVLLGAEITGSRVAVLGAGLVGAETAEFLGAKGKKVEMFDVLDEPAQGLNAPRRYFLMERLKKDGVIYHPHTRILKICLPEIQTEREGKKETFDPFDALVVAAGRRGNLTLAQMIEKQYPFIKLILIGDAAETATAIDAIAQAAQAAAALTAE